MMTIAEKPSDEMTEAVIISGPRRGEFIMFGENYVPTVEAEILLSGMTETANEITETLRLMHQESVAWQQQMDERKKVRNEILGELGRAR